MNKRYCAAILLWIAVLTTAQNTGELQNECDELTDDDIHIFGSEIPYTSDQLCIVNTNPGYKILVTIVNLDIDSNSKDYLIIKPGPTLESIGPAKVFTHIIKIEREYVIPSNSAYMLFKRNGESNVNELEGFNVTYQRIGEELPMTTEPPITDSPFPTPAVNDSMYLNVYIHGVKISSIYYDRLLLNSLRTVISKMAIEFCDVNNIPVEPTEPITYENVLINEIAKCPFDWPDRDNCIAMRFALPVFTIESYSGGYQLSSVNLEIMWERYSGYLDEIGLSVYEVPDNNMTFWLLIVFFTLAVILVALLVLRVFINKIITFNSWKLMTNETSMDSSVRNRAGSIGSLRPDQYQIFPKLNEMPIEMSIEELYEGTPKRPFSGNSIKFMDNEQDAFA